MKKKLHIFDLDGVLTNTTHIHTDALKQAVAELVGPDAAKHRFLLDASDGRTTKDKLNNLHEEYRFFNKQQVDDRKKELTLEKLNDLPASTMRNALLELKKKHVRLVLASNSRKEFVDVILKKIGLSDLFDLVLSGDMFLNGKPNPEIFVHAMNHFCIKPENTVIYEDSISGCKAAWSAKVSMIVHIDPEKLITEEDLVK